jgi:excisionase family DNA binding protein
VSAQERPESPIAAERAVEPVYLTPRDVAKRLSVSTKTVGRWIKARQMPVTTLPSGTLRFHPDRLEMWLSQRTNGTRHQIRSAPANPAKSASSHEVPNGPARG